MTDGSKESLLLLLGACPDVYRAVEALADELLDLSEAELRQLAKPTETDELLKTAFWNEVAHAKSAGIPVRPGELYMGICTRRSFLKKISSQSTLAYIISPKRDELASQQEMLSLAYRKMRRILMLPIHEWVYDDRGNKVGKKPNIALMKLQVDIGQKIEARLKGSVVQRAQIEQKTLTVRAQPDSLREIQAQLEAIKVLEAKVTPEEVLSAATEFDYEPPPEPEKRDPQVTRDGKIKEPKTPDGSVL